MKNIDFVNKKKYNKIMKYLFLTVLGLTMLSSSANPKTKNIINYTENNQLTIQKDNQINNIKLINKLIVLSAHEEVKTKLDLALKAFISDYLPKASLAYMAMAFPVAPIGHFSLFMINKISAPAFRKLIA